MNVLKFYFSLGKFENIVSAIDEKICYLLSSLKTAGDDLQNQDSSSLNTDYTRFLLKQKEKQMTDSKDTGTCIDTVKG